MKTWIPPIVRNILRLLTAGKYSLLESMTRGTRLTAAEIERAIANYGRELIDAPPDEPLTLDIIEVDHSSPRAWSVVAPLSTIEEGRSDLSIELTLIETDPPTIEIDDIRVR